MDEDESGRLRPLFLLLLGVVTAGGAWLRLHDLGGPSLWLDESLNLGFTRGFFEAGPKAWLLGFEPENGPLYFLGQALWLDCCGSLELEFRLTAALLGLLSVPLFFLALRPLGFAVALSGSILLAASPIHVFYSREGRPYAWLVLFAILLLGALLRSESRRWARVAMAVPFLAAAAAATAAPMLLVFGVAFAVLARRRPALRAVVLAHAGALVYLGVLYLRFPRAEAAAGFGVENLARTLVSALFGELFPERAAEPWAVIAILLLAAVAGAVATMRGLSRGAVPPSSLLAPAAIGIVVATLTALAVTRHWVSPRYVLPALPVLLALVGAGLVELARLARLRGWSGWAAIAGSAALAWPLAAIAFEDARWKPDWRGIARSIEAHGRAGDTVVAADAWVAASLRPYLDEAATGLRLIDAGGSVENARYVVSRRERAFLVSGGFLPRQDVAAWMRCGFMPWLEEPVEDVRVAYAPGLRDFLRHRATTAEVERFARVFHEVRGGRLELGRGDELFLLDGWHGPEDEKGASFRWSAAHASLLLPRWLPGSSFRYRATPFGSRVSVALSVDGRPAARFTVEGANREGSIPLPDVGPGLHEIGLAFDPAVRPADVSESSDVRVLSVAWDWVEISPGTGAGGRALLLTAFHPDLPFRNPAEPRIRLREVPPLEPRRRERLLLAMGFDPAVESRRLEAGAVDLVTLLGRAVGIDCGSDEEFLTRAYLLLFARHPDESGMRDYLERMQAGATRIQVADWLLEGWAAAGGTIPPGE